MRPNINYRNIDKIQSQRIASGLSSSGDAAHRRGGSGSRWYAKGDVISTMFLVEAKDKAKPSKSRTIHKEHLEKIKREAIQENKIPLYVVSFGDGVDYFILEDTYFYHLLDRLITAEEKLNL